LALVSGLLVLAAKAMPLPARQEPEPDVLLAKTAS
jgi:hypothetical protein